MRNNSMKRLLSAGDIALGMWATLGSEMTIEIAATFAFDWILIDCEHGQSSYESVPNLLRALGDSSATSLVRVPSANNLSIFKRVLDAGAEGVLVPQVYDAKQVNRIVDACRYPPKGSRGIASSRAQKYGADFFDTFTRSNDEILVIVQIETKEAVENLEEIMSIDGLDGIFVGFADLSAALGKPFDLESLEYKAAIDKVISCAKEFEKPAGYYCSNYEEVKFRIKQGFQFVNICADQSLLIEGFKNSLDSMRKNQEQASS